MIEKVIGVLNRTTQKTVLIPVHRILPKTNFNLEVAIHKFTAEANASRLSEGVVIHLAETHFGVGKFEFYKNPRNPKEAYVMVGQARAPKNGYLQIRR